MRVAITGANGYIGKLMAADLIKLALRERREGSTQVPDGKGIENIILYDARGVSPELRTPGLVDIAPSSPHFCDSKSDVYYLALHPNDRDYYLDKLVPKGTNILCEKPMSTANKPGLCERLIRQAEEYNPSLLYNYILIPHKITGMINDFLSQYSHVDIHNFEASFQKNRESRLKRRNRSVMETIEIQEAVHPIALFLYLMANVSHQQVSFPNLFPEGVKVRAKSKFYDAPNQLEYRYKVNGYVGGGILTLSTPPTRVALRVNFKRFDGNKPTLPEKIIRIRGTGDGKPFSIEANYQSDAEYLVIGGIKQELGQISPYEDVWIRAFQDFHDMRKGTRRILADPSFSWLAYQLGMAMWFSSHSETELLVSDSAALSRYAYAYHNKPVRHANPHVFYWLIKEGLKTAMDAGIDYWASRLQANAERTNPAK